MHRKQRISLKARDAVVTFSVRHEQHNQMTLRLQIIHQEMPERIY